MSDETKSTDLYKDTVFLPRTDFPMRGELPKKEPEILKKWQDMDLYARVREVSQGKEKWVLHWGPPYANGHAHMGHAFTKALKDVVNRCWQMKGCDAPLVPGWDCHGLPIEWKIEEKYRAAGKNKDEVDPITFRDECRAFAKGWADIQSTEFQRLGVLADWKNPYLTMTNAAEAGIVREIHKFLKNGLLYRGVKPVMWSTVEKTALAEAEIEYKEHKSVTVWVGFPVISKNHPALHNTRVVIWTTTPWTLPSNRAIAFNPAMDYALYDVRRTGDGARVKPGDRLLLSVKLAADVKEKAKIEEWEQEITFKGVDLSGVVCAHPLRAAGYDFDVPLLAGDFVTDDTGTGFVHIAPGHGEDDFNLGKIHDLPITDNVTDDGKFRDHVPLFAGKEIYTQKGELGDGNFAVIKAMDEAGALLAKSNLKHEYPHSWRSKAPLIFRTTPQWFIALDDKNRLREKSLAAIKETKWVPAKGETRITAMISQRPDWCISRQRAWGVPIALFVNKKTGEIIKDEAVLKRIGDLFESEGSDAWWVRPAQDFLGNDYDAGDYEQIFDIVDVWFESGSTHAFVLGDTETWPVFKGVEKADLYLEGSDQHRGWFHSSLLESCGTRGHAPYKTVLTHGFVLDEKGYKMSKSLGNVVDPQEMIGQHGADIIRLWAMLSDYSEDIRIGKDTLKLTADLYRRIRNTFRYLLGALDGFTVDEKVTDISSMPELERLMLHELAQLDEDIRKHIENYEFGKLAHRLHDFCNGDLSSFYFDIRKDSLYCDRSDSLKRRACRTVMAHIFDCLVTWLAPILAFTAEEAWSHRPHGIFDDAESVHLRIFPDVPKNWRDDALAAKWGKIKIVRSTVSATLEPFRKDKKIGSSLEASPAIMVTEDFGTSVDFAEICITSSALVTVGPVAGATFREAEGHKCERCWKILPETGQNKHHPDLCHRCADAVDFVRKDRKAA